MLRDNHLTFFLIFTRHLKNKKAANELLTKLKDNRELQHFLQDGQEVKKKIYHKQKRLKRILFESHIEQSF